MGLAGSQQTPETPAIAQGTARTHPQALTAAVAVEYAASWPDDPGEIESRLESFDLSAPHECDTLRKMIASTRASRASYG
jgi:hypothetical protein